ncbi:MAG: hypothetical protein LLG37_00375 [Spirochaetia bacterium]|nr:hypothetical protein [Spirochaetia bacterium]
MMKRKIVLATMFVFAATVLFAADASTDISTAAKNGGLVKDDSFLYYPAHVGEVLYFKATKRAEPEKLIKVKASVIGTEKKEDGEFYYFYGPKVDVRYLIGIDRQNGVYMRVIKYPFPLFDFSIEVDLVPKMHIIKFPLTVGQKWAYSGKAKAHLLFIPITRKIEADFEIVEKKTLKTEAGDVETYHIRVSLDEGDGRGRTIENYWYGKGIGYSAAETSGHVAEIVGYRIYDEVTGKWIEKLPADPQNYQ